MKRICLRLGGGRPWEGTPWFTDHSRRHVSHLKQIIPAAWSCQLLALKLLPSPTPQAPTLPSHPPAPPAHSLVLRPGELWCRAPAQDQRCCRISAHVFFTDRWIAAS